MNRLEVALIVFVLLVNAVILGVVVADAALHYLDFRKSQKRKARRHAR